MVTPEEFVRTWQTAGSLQEVCQKTGLTQQAAQSKAYYYRKRGVPLKKFSNNSGKNDWEKLTKLAEELKNA